MGMRDRLFANTCNEEVYKIHLVVIIEIWFR